MIVSNRKKEETKETHNYLDFSKYFLCLYLKFLQSYWTFQIFIQTIQILAP